MNRDISSVRHDYSGDILDVEDTPATPLPLFDEWIQAALANDPEDANTMTLATVDAQGSPHARIVLLKGFDENGLRFFTNYHSHKGEELAASSRAALVFWWPGLARQVRVEGKVHKVSADISEQYFHSRPRESQLGAVASPQSQTIESRQWLLDHYQQVTRQYEDKGIERPANWGGYQVVPTLFEFWQGQPGRMHDRLRYIKKDISGSDPVQWQKVRLAP